MPIKRQKEDTGRRKIVDEQTATVTSNVPVVDDIPSTEDAVSVTDSQVDKNLSYGNGRNGYGGSYNGDTIRITGMLEILTDYGVIRQSEKTDDELPRDAYISHSQIKRFNLRMGDVITGLARPPKENERYLSLLKIETVGGTNPENARKRPVFSKLTPIFPDEWLKLETKPDVISTRLIDLISPIGKGQRAMIVAPPKAGKTFLLLDIANGITTNYPEISLLVALIGERPEEVTHFSRSVKGEVYASNFDEKAEEQTRISELCLEKAKRLAEIGKDVVILVDSITRLARAYNMVAPPSGRTLTGGFDPAALYPAKHFFGAARNLENSGSLTIIATALVDTGSRMDDVIFEEFKGTGNMELRLDRSLSERRIFPSIDIKASATRHEEDLLDKDTLEKVYRLRRMIDLLDDRDATPLVIDQLKKTKSNKEFLESLNKGGVK
ncbi:MAG: transcription termination factor Rho [Patescibacteria group bacterium]